MYDPASADWFLQYTDSQGRKNGTIYNEPGAPGDQFFWDFRVPAAVDYYVASVLNSTTWTDGRCEGGVDCVDGSSSDDLQGIPLGHPNCTANLGLNASQVADIQAATQAASGRLIDAAVQQGKYVWHAFGALDDVGPGVTRSACTQFMRERCPPAFQALAVTQQHDRNNSVQSIAAFLVVRGPVAFLGHGWESDTDDWDPNFALQVGVPTGDCSEAAPGVFVRGWSYGNVSLDCNDWTGAISHAEGVLRVQPQPAAPTPQSEQ